MLWQWAKKRHPNKGGRWAAARYFQPTRTRVWNFVGAAVPGATQLPRHSEANIIRHKKVKGTMSPMDPDARAYRAERRRERLDARTYSKRRQELLKVQGYACASCEVPFDPDEDIDMMDEHHATPRRKGGGNETGNLRFLHRWCHHKHHQQAGYKAAEA